MRVFTIELIDTSLLPHESARFGRDDSPPPPTASPDDQALASSIAERMRARFPELTITPDGTTLYDLRGGEWSEIKIANRIIAVAFPAWPDPQHSGPAWSKNEAYVAWLAAESGFAPRDPATGKTLADPAAARGRLLHAYLALAATSPPPVARSFGWYITAAGFALVNVAVLASIAVTARENLARGSPTVIVQAALLAAWLYAASRYVRTRAHVRQAINTVVAVLGAAAALLAVAGVVYRAISVG